MIALAIMLVLSVGALVGCLFLLGFRLGGRHLTEELARTKFEAAQAQRQMRYLTRDAFVAMAEHAENRRQTVSTWATPSRDSER
jgi:hypothetical protein